MTPLIVLIMNLRIRKPSLESSQLCGTLSERSPRSDLNVRLQHHKMTGKAKRRGLPQVLPLKEQPKTCGPRIPSSLHPRDFTGSLSEARRKLVQQQAPGSPEDGKCRGLLSDGRGKPNCHAPNIAAAWFGVEHGVGRGV